MQTINGRFLYPFFDLRFVASIEWLEMLEIDESLDKMMSDMVREFEELCSVPESDLEGRNFAKLQMSHYNTIYKIASSGAKDIKERLKVKFEVMLTQYVSRCTAFELTAGNDHFDQLFSMWKRYKYLLNWNLIVFSYFSRVFHVNLETIGWTIFLEQIWRKWAPSVFEVALHQLHLERKGLPIDGAKLAAALSFGMMNQLDDFDVLYEQHLIDPFVMQLIEDEEQLISELDSSCASSGDFFMNIVSALKSEKMRCSLYFPHNRQEAILGVVEELIRNSKTTQRRLISSDGLFLSFETENAEMLKIYFNLFFSDSSTVFSNAFKEVIEQIVEKVQNDVSTSTAYAKEILDLRNKCSRAVKNYFNSSQAVTAVARHTFYKIFEQKIRTKESDRLVNFWESFVLLVDCGLQSLKYRKYIDEENVSILSCLHDTTDIINSLAESMLQRVLDPEHFFLLDLEKHFVEMVSKCVGYRIPLLESIVLDVESSATFFLGCEVVKLSDMFSFVALRRSNWIVTRLVGPEITVPEYITAELNEIHQHYMLATAKRTFKWCHYSSTAVLDANLNSESMTTLYVSASQALILLSLNERDHICVNELVDRHNFLRETLAAEIDFLLDKKLIIKEKNSFCTCSSCQNTEERYVVNHQFSHKDRVLSLLRWVKKDHSELRAEKQAKITRSSGVDAIIIKNLKRKDDTQENLFKYCQESLRYTVSNTFVKTRIEELIRKGYLARDPDNFLSFYYLP